MMHNSQIHNLPNKWNLDPSDQSQLMKIFPWMLLDPLNIGLRFSQSISDIIYTNMRDFQEIFSYKPRDTKIEDPFFETKKKCLPENIDHLPMTERTLVRLKNSYFITIPFTIEKRDWSSFVDKTMNNLIVDNDEQLIQLLYWWTQSSKIRDGQKLMQVLEYIIEWKTVARKFESYIW